MTQRTLHIAAYDISDDRRLRDALRILKGYASGRQKSVFECFLSEAEKDHLIERVRGVIDAEEDRFLLLRLDRRSTILTLGKAVVPADPPWYSVS
jgi:CRISPR-associated protein Cas2